MRNQKGITLIALVITIIVLLILAGISIAMLTGENGILTNAQNSKSQTVYSEAREKMQLAYMAVRTEIAAEKAADSSYNAKLDTTNLQKIVKDDLGTDWKVQVVPASITATTTGVKIIMTYDDSAIDQGSIQKAVAAGEGTDAVPAIPAYDGYVNGEITIDLQTASFAFDTATKAVESTGE